jgi:cobalt-zinc-cadmium resistance protein CzcA
LLSNLALACIRARKLVVVLLVLLLGAGAYAFKRLPIDALPDVSSVQIDIITQAAGLSPTEVERGVTIPIENAVNGVPRNVEIRSISRAGLSLVTVVFKDGTDVWFARQMILERIRLVQGDLPPSASIPELAPVSTGLGTIYRFVLRSPHHSAMQLRTLLDWEIIPKLRTVEGVIEVNSFGGELKQFQVHIDHARLRAHGLSVGDVVEALREAHANVGGGYVERGEESLLVRGTGLLADETEIGNVFIRADSNGTAVLVRHVADVKVGSALRHGVVTLDGEGEVVTGIVMMLVGSNSRDVVYGVKGKIDDIKRELPPGVTVEVLYDRADFVDRTLSTVAANLLEGILVVTFVLALFLGTIRGALVAALGIPVAMAVALIGMNVFGVTGDLMSLGAIDFGFLVDGPIVVLESILAVTAGKQLVPEARAKHYGDVAAAVVKPVGLSLAIIMLVYIPLLTLEGVEGKMFRPMALTMACALFGALLYTIVFFPALLVLFVPPAKGHGPKWIEAVGRAYEPMLDVAIKNRVWVFAGSIVSVVVAVYAFMGAGAEFVPRIFEGDLVVAVRRAPSIGLTHARELDLQTERVLKGFPEVKKALAMTGRAELALDAVGYDSTDILVPLEPMKEWTTAHDFDTLSVKLKDAIETQVPGTFVAVSQPIEDLTNQLISGSRADVSIKVFGSDLDELVRLSNEIGAKVGAIRGTGDLRIERILGQPAITVAVDRERMASYGVRAQDALQVVEAAREGVRVGDVYEQNRRFELRVLGPPKSPTPEAIAHLFVEGQGGRSVPLSEVARIREGEGPSVVKRQNRERLIRIDVNLRGRDLVSWVAEAKQVVGRDVSLDSSYRIEWGGQFENFERASKRLGIVVPIVVAIILGMLFGIFQSARRAIAVFFLVPLASVGGIVGLLARDLPFSLPAAIGFIALGGISVLNGVVIATEVDHVLAEGKPLGLAIREGAASALRAVLTTGAVAAFGFLPMAMSTGAGSEVQRPLATVVVVGIAASTLLTSLVFPAILSVALRPSRARAREPVGAPDTSDAIY